MYVACTLVACDDFEGSPAIFTHQLRCVFSVAVS